MCDALCRGCGWSQTTWFDPNRGWVLLQTTWFDPNRGSVWHQTTWFGPNRGWVLLQTTWFDPNRGSVLLQTTWFGPNQGRVLLQTIGLIRIGVRFCFKPLVWPESEVGFASNHWFGPNRRSVLLQTIGLAQSRAGLGSNQRRFDPNQASQRGCRFTVRYSFRAGVRQGSPCRWRTRRR